VENKRKKKRKRYRSVIVVKRADTVKRARERGCGGEKGIVQRCGGSGEMGKFGIPPPSERAQTREHLGKKTTRRGSEKRDQDDLREAPETDPHRRERHELGGEGENEPGNSEAPPESKKERRDRERQGGACGFTRRTAHRYQK